MGEDGSRDLLFKIYFSKFWFTVHSKSNYSFHANPQNPQSLGTSFRSPGGRRIRRKSGVRLSSPLQGLVPVSYLRPTASGTFPRLTVFCLGGFPQKNLKQVHPADIDRSVNPKPKLELDSLFPLGVLFNLVELSFSFHVLLSVVSVSYERRQQRLLREVEGTCAQHITSTLARSLIIISCDRDLDVYEDPTSPFAQTCALFDTYRCVQLLDTCLITCRWFPLRNRDPLQATRKCKVLYI